MQISLYFGSMGDADIGLPTLVPVITSNGGGAVADVEVLTGTRHITTVTVSNIDGVGDTIFSISGGADAALFTLGTINGTLEFVGTPDYTDPQDDDGDNVYEVEVKAERAPAGFDTQLLRVKVVPVVANTPPVITSYGGLNAVLLDREEGITTVGYVTAYDADLPAQAITFSIDGGEDASSFTIDADTGEVEFVTPPAFSSPSDADGDNHYILIVWATDVWGLGASQTWVVRISESSSTNTAPVIVSLGGSNLASTQVVTGTTLVGTVVATDAQNDVITYSIAGGADAGKFNINSATGVLRFASAPDFHNPGSADSNNRYVVIVEASDGFLSDSQTISVFVIEEPEESEVYAYPPAAVHVTPPVLPALNLPNYLQPVSMPPLNTTLTRITDPSVFGSERYGFKPRSATRSVWSHDGSLMVLDNHDTSGRLLNGNTYELIRTSSNIRDRIPSPVSRHFYGMTTGSNGAEWCRYDPDTDQWTTLATFPQYSSFVTGGRGDISNDGTRVIVVGNRSGGAGIDILVLNPITGERIFTFILPANYVFGQHLRAAFISQSGKYIITCFGSSGSGTIEGHRGWVSWHLNEEGVLVRRLLQEINPWLDSDVGYDMEGHEVLVTLRNVSVSGQSIISIVAIQLAQPSYREVLFPENSTRNNFTISCRNIDRPGYAYISTYRSDDDGYPLYRQVFAVRLDNSRETEVFSEAYFAQEPLIPPTLVERWSVGVPNRTGTKIAFGTDWYNSSPGATVHTIVAEADQPEPPVAGNVYVADSMRHNRMPGSGLYLDVSLVAASAGESQIVVLVNVPGSDVSAPEGFQQMYVSAGAQSHLSVWVRSVVGSRNSETVRFTFSEATDKGLAMAWSVRNEVYGVVGLLNPSLSNSTSPSYEVNQEDSSLFYVSATLTEGRSISLQGGQALTFVGQTSGFGGSPGPDAALAYKDPADITLHPQVQWNLGTAASTVGLTIAVGPHGGSAHDLPRLAATWPFSSNSPWNMPIGSEAQYSTAGSDVTNAVRNVTLGVALYTNSHAVPVYHATAADPLVSVTVNAPSSDAPAGVVQIRMPAGAIPSLPSWDSGAYTDAILVVVEPGGSIAHEFWRMQEVSPGQWNAGAYTPTPLDGSGVELVQGLEVSGHQIPGQLGWAVARTSGVSAMGGLIRSGEVGSVIRHALAISSPPGSLRTPWMWPASRSRVSYTPPGALLLGSLLAIPKSTNLSALNLRPQELVIAKALQDFGAYIVTDESSWGIYIEAGIQSEFSSVRTEKLAELWGFLTHVTNNTSLAVGGGGIPLVPLAPPLTFSGSGGSSGGEQVVLFNNGRTVTDTLFGTVNYASDAFPKNATVVSWYGGHIGDTVIGGRSVSRSTAATMLQFMILNPEKGSGWTNADYDFSALSAYVNSLPSGVKLLINVYCNLSGSSVVSYEGDWTIPSISATRYRDAITRLVNTFGADLAGLELTNAPPVSLFGGTESDNWMNAWAGSAALFAQQARVVKQTLASLSSTLPVVGPSWANVETWTTSALTSLFNQSSDGGLDAGFGTGSGNTYADWIDAVGLHGEASTLLRFHNGITATRNAMAAASIGGKALWITRWNNSGLGGAVEDTWAWFDRIIVSVAGGVDLFVHESWVLEESIGTFYQGSTSAAALNRARFDALTDWLLEETLDRAVILTNGRTRVWRNDGAVLSSGTLPSSISLPVVGQGRDLQRHPFRNDDPWNTPITSAATWSTSGAAVSDLRSYRSVSEFGASSFDNCYPKVYAATNDPLVSVNVGGAGGTTGNVQIRIPFVAVPSTPEWTPIANFPAYLLVCDPDGVTVHEFSQFRWTNPARTTAAAAAYIRTRTDSWGVMYAGHGTLNPLLPSTFSSTWWLHPDGYGTVSSANYGGSIHGGLIQHGDFTANIWGYIPHALSVKLNVDMVEGTIDDPQWPASRQDGNTDPRGQIKIGTLFGLPSSVDVDALSLSPEGKILARTLQNYGAYVVGVGATAASGNPGTFFHIDGNAGAQEKQALLAALEDYRNVLRPLIAICTNNAPQSQKGGGTPLVDKNADAHYVIEDVVDPVPPGVFNVTPDFFGIVTRFQPFYWAGELPDTGLYAYAQYYEGDDTPAKYGDLNWIVEDGEGDDSLGAWVNLHQSRGHRVRIGAMINQARRDQTLQTAMTKISQTVSLYGGSIDSWFVAEGVKQILSDPQDLTAGWTGTVGRSTGSDGWVTLSKTQSSNNEFVSTQLPEGNVTVVFSFLAGTASQVSFQLRSDGLGDNVDSEAFIITGPGSLVRDGAGAAWSVAGLDANHVTWVGFRRRNVSSGLTLRVYPGGLASTSSGASIKTRHPVVTQRYASFPYHAIYRTLTPVLTRDMFAKAGWYGTSVTSNPDANGWVTVTRTVTGTNAHWSVDTEREVLGVAGRLEIKAGNITDAEIQIINNRTGLPEPTNRFFGQSIGVTQGGIPTGGLTNGSLGGSTFRVVLHPSLPAIIMFRVFGDGQPSTYTLRIIAGGVNSTIGAHTVSVRRVLLAEGGGQFLGGHDFRPVPAWAVEPTDLLSNGSFSNGVAGWTVTGASGSNDVFPQSSGGVRFEFDNNPLQLTQASVMTIGKSYVLEWDSQVTTGGLWVEGSDIGYRLPTDTGTLTFVASTTSLVIGSLGNTGNVFLRSVTLKEVMNGGPMSYYDYYAHYISAIKKAGVLAQVIGPGLPDIDTVSRKELLGYLSAEDAWGVPAGQLLDKVAFGTGVEIASLQRGYVDEIAALKSDLVTAGFGSAQLAWSKFWVSREDTPLQTASQNDIQRWYVLATLAAVQEGVESLTFYEFASDAPNSPFNDPGALGDNARTWLNTINQWWTREYVTSIQIGSDGSGLAVNQSGDQLIVLPNEVLLPEYDPEVVESFFTLANWDSSVVGSNASVTLNDGAGILSDDAINFATLSGVGSSASIYRNLVWNMDGEDGFWLLHRVNRRNSSAGVGLSLTLSNSVDMGDDRYTRSPVIYAGAVGTGSTWVAKSDFAVSHGSPSWSDPILSYEFSVASHATAVRDFDLLGVVLRRETARIVFTNDLGYSSVATAALPLHVARDIPMTCFIDPALVGTPDYLTYEQAQDLLDAGVQLSLTGSLSWAEDTDRIDTDKAAAVTLGGVDTSYAAYPLGDIGEGADWENTVLALQNVNSVRLSGGGTPFLREHVNSHAVPTFLLTSANNVTAAKAAVDRAIQAGGTLIFQGYRYGASANATQWSVADLTELLDYVESKVTSEEVEARTYAHWWSGSEWNAPGSIIIPQADTPELISEYDIRTFEDGPLSVLNTSFTRASPCMVKDYRGYWLRCEPGEIPLAGGRRVDHEDSVDYGWGVQGIEWLSTDASDNPISTNVLRGLQIEREETNIIRSSSDLTTGAWERRGALNDPGITTGTDEAVGGTYSQLRGMSGPGASDVYQIVSGLTPAARYESRFVMRRVDGSTGGMAFNNPMNGLQGSWVVDLSQLPDNQWVEITRDHPAVTLNQDHEVFSNGILGIHLYREWGTSTLDVDVALFTMVPGTSTPLTPILNESENDPATRAGSVFSVGGLSLPDGFTTSVAFEMVSGTHAGSVAYSVHDSNSAANNKTELVVPGNTATITTSGSVVANLSLPTLPAGRYIAAVATRENDHYLRVINSTQSSTAAGTASASTNELQLGGGGRNASSNMTGYIVAWSVYDQRLTNAEIAGLMQGQNMLMSTGGNGVTI